MNKTAGSRGIYPVEWDANIPPGVLLRKNLIILAIAVSVVGLFLEILSLTTDSPSFIFSLWAGFQKNDSSLKYAAGFIGFWLLLSFLFCWAIYGRGYEASFGVNEKGAWMKTRPKMRKKNRIINGLLFFLSLFSRNPTGMGTAMLAESAQSSRLVWRDVQRIGIDPTTRSIDLKGGWRTLMTLYCTDENYEQVLEIVNRAVDFE